MKEKNLLHTVRLVICYSCDVSKMGGYADWSFCSFVVQPANVVGFPNWHVSGCQEQVGWGSWLLNLCEEKNIEIESIFAETMLLLAELHPNWRRWLRRCDTSLQVHLDAQASLTTSWWVSLSTFLTATNRSNQIASTVSQGHVRVKIFPIYCHIL